MFPQGWDRRTTVLLTFALLFVINTNLAPAQVFNLESERAQFAEMHGLWRFHTGDDPRWADPDFDDSNWALLKSDQDWGQQGYKGYSGVAWYRFKVELPTSNQQYALGIPQILTSYQVFADGRQIGQFGGMPPHPYAWVGWYYGSQVFALPEAKGRSGTLSIAIRVWHWPYFAEFVDGGPGLPLCVGERRLVLSWKANHDSNRFWGLSDFNLMLLLNCLAGLAGLALFILRRNEREYLWFGAAELFNAAFYAQGDFILFFPQRWLDYSLLSGLLSCSAYLFFLAFVVEVLHARRSWPYWLAVASIVGQFLVVAGVGPGWIRLSSSYGASVAVSLPYYACVIALLFRGVRQRVPDATILLAPITLSYAISFLWGLIVLVIPNDRLDRFDWVINLSSWPFPFGLQNVADFLTQVSLLAILVFRFARTRNDELRWVAELESARTVQQVLIPEEIPAIPGLALECVYKPAGQVGGDFFQILPTPSNGALIVIGDVSGKGMPAAMAVSLLVGTVRTLAHYTHSPGEILTAMNLRMLGRSKNGFTTCLVLRLDQDGSATVANAGHLAPYLGSNEVPVESGLPLGLAAEAEYTESNFHFDLDETLTLVTDGVAEARAKTGELFGFERTASIAILSAQHIAATAQAFGQEDDITVLKIHRQPTTELAELAQPSLSPPLPESSTPECLSS